MIQQKYPLLARLTKQKVHRLVKRFEQKGSITDPRYQNTGRPRSARKPEAIKQVKEIINETPQRSVRKVMGDINNTISASSVYRALRFDLNLVPYTISVMQHLKPTDIESRMLFAKWTKEQPDSLINKIWFSDEAHFYLNAQVNKKNCRFWGTEKPKIYLEKPLHDQKVTVWAALSASGLIGPFFFEDDVGNVATVNSERYLGVLRKKLLPALRRRSDIDMKDVWFQQDGAAPHTSNMAIVWLERTFGTKLISLRTETAWPPHSPDLNPLDFFLWGCLKDRVYSPAPTSTEELKSAIRREMKKISSETCKAVIRNFRERIDVMVANKGRHLEHLL